MHVRESERNGAGLRPFGAAFVENLNVDVPEGTTVPIIEEIDQCEVWAAE